MEAISILLNNREKVPLNIWILRSKNCTTSILVQDKVAIHHRNLATNWRMKLKVNLIETHYYLIAFPPHFSQWQAY